MLMSSWLTMLGSRIRNQRRRTTSRSRLGKTVRDRAAAQQRLTQQAETLEIRQVLSVNQWVSMGPYGIINGQAENVDAPGANPVKEGKPENFVNGAVNVVLPHPTNPDILFVGGVNGGVWRTVNATSTTPDWEPISDFETSLAIGDMTFDSEDLSGNRLLVAIGNNSSFGDTGAVKSGLLLTENALAAKPTFLQRGKFELEGVNLTGVTMAGDQIVVSANEKDGGITPGVYFSNDEGISFTHAVGMTDPAFDIVQDPTESTRLYAGTSKGLYRSDDGGESWTIASSKVQSVITSGTNNMELAFHYNEDAHTKALYAIVVNDGQASGIFRESRAIDGIDNDDNGFIDEIEESNFVPMDLPRTLEGPNGITGATNANPIVITAEIKHRLSTGQNYQVIISGVGGNTAANGEFTIKPINETDFEIVGVAGNGNYSGGGTFRLASPLQPKAKPGSAGETHLSIIADPDDPFIVYVGGDRQETLYPGIASFQSPNSQGARDYTARIYRGDALTPRTNKLITVGVPGSQWSPITHFGTKSSSAPHADSRMMAFDVNGRLLEGDDGGIYALAGPRGGSITGVFNDEPIVIQSRAHGLKTGDTVRITGVTGKTDANGTFTITRLNADEFSLDDTDDDDAYTGGGVWGASDWVSLNQGLQLTEIHDIAWDSNSNRIVIGNQDNGTAEQNPKTGSPFIWASIAKGDGGDVAVDNVTLAAQNQSIRYSSNQNLGGFTRRVIDAGGNVVSDEDVSLKLPATIGAPFTITGATSANPVVITAPNHGLSFGNLITISGVTGNTAANGTFLVVPIDNNSFKIGDPNTQGFINGAMAGAYTGGGTGQRIPAQVVGKFVSPTQLNENDPKRMVIVTKRGTYESFDQGETLNEIGPGSYLFTTGNSQNAVAYGDKPGGTHADVVYVGLGRALLGRLSGTGQLKEIRSYFEIPDSGNIRDVVLDPDDPFTVYVVDNFQQVFQGRQLNYSMTDGIDNDADGMMDDEDLDEVPFWVNITENMPAVEFQTVAFIPGKEYDVLTVGTSQGVYMRRFTDAAHFPQGDWVKLGAQSLPNVPVWDLDYDADDDVLVAGTLGRGAWLINTAGNFGGPSANGLFETVGGTGDMLTLNVGDYALANSFAINSISLPDAGENVTMTPHALGFTLSVGGEDIGVLVMPENLGDPDFETSGVLHFIPSLSSEITFDEDTDAPGFQGRVKIDVTAGPFDFSVYFNVQPGYSAENGVGGVDAGGGSGNLIGPGGSTSLVAVVQSSTLKVESPFLITDALTKENILRLQHRLAALGFRGTSGKVPKANGVIDAETTSALRLFQSAIDPTGTVVPTTQNLGQPYVLASGTLDARTLQWLNAEDAPQWVELSSVNLGPYPLGPHSQFDPPGPFEFLPLPDPVTEFRSGATATSERFVSSWVANAFRSATSAIDFGSHPLSFPANPNFFPPHPDLLKGFYGLWVKGASEPNGIQSAASRDSQSRGRHNTSGMEIEIYLPINSDTAAGHPGNGVFAEELLRKLREHAALSGNGIVIKDAVFSQASAAFIDHVNGTVFAGQTNASGQPVARVEPRATDYFPQFFSTLYIQFGAPELPPSLSPIVETALDIGAESLILFAAQLFLPTGEPGGNLLSHNLNHVVQQTDGGSSQQPQQSPNQGNLQAPSSPPQSNLLAGLMSSVQDGQVGTPSNTPVSDLEDDEAPTFDSILGFTDRIKQSFGTPVKQYFQQDETPTLPELLAFLDTPGSPLSNYVEITNTNDLIEFSFDIDFGRHITRDLNFGDMLASTGLDLDTAGKIDLEVSMKSQATVSIDLTDGKAPQEAVSFQFDPIVVEASAEIPADPGLDISARLGFFGVSIKDGSLDLSAKIQATVNNGNEFTVGQLLQANPSTFFDFADPIGTINAVLPIGLQIGTFDSDTVFGPTVENGMTDLRPRLVIQVDNFFDGIEKDDFALKLPPKLNLFDVDTGGINWALDQVRDFLKQMQGSPLLAAQIPFTNGTKLGDAFDFALAFDQQISNFTIGLDGLPSFGTVQELADELPGLDDEMPVDIVENADGDYVLVFNFDLSKTFAPKTAKLSLAALNGADAGIVGIKTNSNVSITADVGATFSMGVLLKESGADVVIDGSTKLSKIVPAMASENGQPAQDRWDFLDTNGATADVRITLRNGSVIDVDLSPLKGATVPAQESTLSDVVALLNSKVGPNFAQIKDKRFVFTDPTTPNSGESKFKIQDVNNSGLAMVAQLVGVDSDKDGVITSAPLHGKSLADRVYIENADLHASATLSANDIDATASFGGLIEIGVVDGFGSINVDAKIAVVNPVDKSSRVTLGEIIRELKDLGKGSDLVDITVNAAADLTLPIVVTTLLNEPLTGMNPQITVSWPQVFTVDLDQGKVALNTGSLNVQFSNFDELLNFKDFDADDIVGLLGKLADFLSSLAKDNEFFKDKLPVINKSPAELLNFVSEFSKAIKNFQKNPANGLSEIQNQLNTALGTNKPDSKFDPIQLSLDLDGAEPVVRIDLPFKLDVTTELPLNFDLDALGVPVLSDLVDFQGEGMLDVDAGLLFNLAVGLEVLAGQPRAFLYDEDTEFGANLKVASDPMGLNFKASIGPFGAKIEDGAAALDIDGLGAGTAPAAATLTLTDSDGDGRHYFDEGVGLILDDLFFELDGAAGINLPINTLSGTPLDTSDPMNPTSSLVVTIPDLEHPFDVVVDKTPDFQSLLDNLDFSDGIGGIILGIDGLLQLLENVLDGEVFGQKLPFIGDKLKDAATFIGDIREDLIANLLGTTNLKAGGSNLAAANDGTPKTGINEVQQAIFDAIGPGNLDFLLDTNNDGSITIADVQIYAGKAGATIENKQMQLVTDFLTDVSKTTDTVQFNMKLGSDLINYPLPLGLDLGIPGLGLDIDGTLQVAVGFEYDFRFGISKTDGVFFDVSNPSDLQVNVDIELQDLVAQGQLGPLQLDVTQMPVSELDEADDQYSHDMLSDPESERARSRINLGTAQNPDIIEAINAFKGRFAIDITDGTSQGRLGITEIGQADIDAKLGAIGTLHLNAMASLGGDANFPSIGTEIHLYWGFDNIANFGDADPIIEFRDVGLNMGEFITGLFGGALEVVQDIVEPIQPILDVLTSPIPVISDLAGSPVALVDLARIFGLAKVADFIEAVDTVADLVTSLPSPGDALIIPLGGFELVNGEIQRDAAANAFNFDTALDAVGGPQAKATADYFKSIPRALTGNGNGNLMAGSNLAAAQADTKGKFAFPILDNPSMVFNLLLGKDVSLVTYDMPRAEFGFEYSQFFTIFGPIGARIGGEVGFALDFAFGFDTKGFFDFAKSLDVRDIFNGFYISDTANADGSGEDVPEMQLFGALKAAAELNLGLASASVGGGIFLTVDFDLHDNPDENGKVDGKIRVPEIVENALLSPIPLVHIFDISGKVEAGLEATVSTLGFSETFEIAKVTLVDFEIPRPDPTPGDPEAVLATVDDNGKLTVNIGPNAGARLFGDLSDGNDNVVIRRNATDNAIIVMAFGLQRSFTGVTSIYVDAGSGDDAITLDKSIDLPATLIGGDGNDIIIGAKGAESIVGGAGNDKLNGNDGNDTIEGDEGSDTILGASGDDSISGGADGDSIDGAGGEDTINAGAGNDTLQGGPADNVINGDEGNDKIFGGKDSDLITGGDGVDTIFGEDGQDSIKGGAGNDLIDGGIANDLIEGGEGDDVIDGDQGNDVVKGEAGNDNVIGGPGSDSLDGGSGDDLITAGDGPNPGAPGSIYSGEANSTHVIIGGAGSDTIHGDLGDDNIDAGEGDNVIFEYAGNATIKAGGGADYIVTAAGNELIDAGNGNNTVLGGTGSETVTTGSGNDVIDLRSADDPTEAQTTHIVMAGAGNNLIHTDKGSDTIVTGVGNDTVFAFDGDNSIEVGGGNDKVTSGAGKDTITTGDGADTVSSGDGADLLTVGNDDDLVMSEGGNDTIFAEAGDDTVVAGAGNDDVFLADGDDSAEGGDGNDFIVGALGDDFINAGNGSDVVWGGTAVYGRATFDLTVANNFQLPPDFAAFDLLNPSGYTPPQITPIVVNGNSLPGTPDDGEDVIRGGDGTDFLFGGGQVDDIKGGSGDDFIDGGVGGELIHGDAGDDVIFGGANDDNLFGDEGIDQLYGQEGNDILRAGPGIGVGDTGNPRFNRLIATDVPAPGSGQTVHVMSGQRSYGGDGSDSLYAFAPSNDSSTESIRRGDELHGGSGNDFMYGNIRRDVLSGGNGNDFLHGEYVLGADYGINPFSDVSGGADTAYGDSGEDQLFGGSGIDFLKLDTAEFYAEVGDIYDGHYGNRTKGDVIDDNATDIVLIEGTNLADIISISEQDVGITAKSDLAPALVANGRPSAAPVFTLNVNGTTIGPVTVTGTTNNNSLTALAVDINNALDAILDPPVGIDPYPQFSAGQIRAVRIGNRIRFETRNLGQDTSLKFTALNSVMTNELLFDATSFGVPLLDVSYNAGTEVGITSSVDIATNGKLTGAIDATFTLSINGTSLAPATLTVASTADNTTIDDLVADLNAVVHASLLATPAFAANTGVLKFVRTGNRVRLMTQGLGRDTDLQFVATNSITRNQLRIGNTGNTVATPLNRDMIRVGWRSPTGTPLVEQIRISGLGGNDEIGFATGAMQPDFSEIAARSRDWVGVIDGGEGNDIISGSNARDRLDGGRGSDLVYGNEGDDRLFGDPGNGSPMDTDVMFAGAGNDDLIGGLGTNRLFAWSFDPTGPLHFDGEQKALRVGLTPAKVTAYARQLRSGVLQRDARFSLSVNGSTFKDIVLPASSTTTNTKIADLVADLQAVVNAANLGSVVAVGVDSNMRLTFTAATAPSLTIRGDQFGVFVAPNGQLVDTDGSAQNLQGSPFPFEDTGLNRMLGMSGNDTLFGGTGLDFMYGNDGDDVLITRHGDPFEAGFDVPADDEWKAYARSTDKVWYYGGTNLDDVISVDYVTEPGLLGGHHLITRLTNNNGNFSFDAQVRLDFNATDENGNQIFDATDVIQSLDAILEANPEDRGLKFNELALSGKYLPPEGDFLAIIIDALDGNDVVNVGPTVLKTVWTDGGKGDDTILYQSGNPILVDRTEEQDRNEVAGNPMSVANAYSLFGPTILLGGVSLPSDFKLTEIARFDVRLFGDDDFTRLRILPEVTANNGSLNDLIADINAEIAAQGLGERLVAMSVGGKLGLRPTNDELSKFVSQIAMQRLGTATTPVLTIEGVNAGATSAFGFVAGQSTTLADLSQSVAFEDLTLDSPTDVDWYSFRLSQTPQAGSNVSVSSISENDGLTVRIFREEDDGSLTQVRTNEENDATIGADLTERFLIGGEVVPSGVLTNDVAFTLTVGSGNTKKILNVTVTAASTAGNLDVNALVQDVRAAVNSAAATAGLASGKIPQVVNRNGHLTFARAAGSSLALKSVFATEEGAAALGFAVTQELGANNNAYPLDSIGNLKEVTGGSVHATSDGDVYRFDIDAETLAFGDASLAIYNISTTSELIVELYEDYGSTEDGLGTLVDSKTVVGQFTIGFKLGQLNEGTHALRVRLANPGSNPNASLYTILSNGGPNNSTAINLSAIGRADLLLDGDSAFEPGRNYYIQVTSAAQNPTIYDLSINLNGNATVAYNLGTRFDVNQRRDVLLGGEGNDRLQGGPSEDWIFGGAGNDVMTGGLDKQAEDLLFGGPGDDLFQIVPDKLAQSPSGQTVLTTQADRFDGGAGFDQVLYQGGDYDRLSRPVPDNVAIRFSRFLQRYEITSLVWDIANQDWQTEFQSIRAIIRTAGVPTAINGVLSANATFSLEVAGHGAVNITVTKDDTNLTLLDIAKDINSALAEAGIANDVVCEVTSTGLQLASTAFGANALLKITAANSVTTNELKFKVGESAGGLVEAFEQRYASYQVLNTEGTRIETRAGDDVVHADPEYKFPLADGSNVIDSEWGIKAGNYQEGARIAALYIDGGDGNDRLFGGVLADTILGGDGADYIAGGDGDDKLDGGPGRDLIVGLSGVAPDDYEAQTRDATSQVGDETGFNDSPLFAALLPNLDVTNSNGNTFSNLSFNTGDSGDWYLLRAPQSDLTFGGVSNAVLSANDISVTFDDPDDQSLFDRIEWSGRNYSLFAATRSDPNAELSYVPVEQFSGSPEYYLLHVNNVKSYGIRGAAAPTFPSSGSTQVIFNLTIDGVTSREVTIFIDSSDAIGDVVDALNSQFTTTRSDENNASSAFLSTVAFAYLDQASQTIVMSLKRPGKLQLNAIIQTTIDDLGFFNGQSNGGVTDSMGTYKLAFAASVGGVIDVPATSGGVQLDSSYPADRATHIPLGDINGDGQGDYIFAVQDRVATFEQFENTPFPLNPHQGIGPSFARVRFGNYLDGVNGTTTFTADANSLTLQLPAPLLSDSYGNSSSIVTGDIDNDSYDDIVVVVRSTNEEQSDHSDNGVYIIWGRDEFYSTNLATPLVIDVVREADVILSGFSDVDQILVPGDIVGTGGFKDLIISQKQSNNVLLINGNNRTAAPFNESGEFYRSDFETGLNGSSR